MSDVKAVVDAAQRLDKQKDEAALEILIGLREKAIQEDPSLKDDVVFEPKYDTTTMGPLDAVKRLGRRVLHRWSKELYGIVCGSARDYENERKTLLDSLNLGHAALIAAVVSCLLSLGVPAAITAAAAPFIVRRFIEPAKDELCKAWKEAIEEFLP